MHVISNQLVICILERFPYSKFRGCMGRLFMCHGCNIYTHNIDLRSSNSIVWQSYSSASNSSTTVWTSVELCRVTTLQKKTNTNTSTTYSMCGDLSSLARYVIAITEKQIRIAWSVCTLHANNVHDGGSLHKLIYSLKCSSQNVSHL